MSYDCHKTFRADWFQTDSPIKPTSSLCTDPRLFQYNAYQVSTINWKLHLKTNQTQKTVGTPMLKKESNWTTVLTPLALQRFLSHMNSLLLTLGW